MKIKFYRSDASQSQQENCSHNYKNVFQNKSSFIAIILVKQYESFGIIFIFVKITCFKLFSTGPQYFLVCSSRWTTVNLNSKRTGLCDARQVPARLYSMSAGLV